MNAQELRKISDEHYLAIGSELFDEVLEECKRYASMGMYSCNIQVSSKYSSDEILSAVKKFNSLGYLANSQRHEIIKYQPKWYEFNKEWIVDTYYTIYVYWKELKL